MAAKPSIAEIVDALETQRAATVVQKHAAVVAKRILLGRELPPGYFLNRRGRPSKDVWKCSPPPSFESRSVEWPYYRTTVAALDRVEATEIQQLCIAYEIRRAIRVFGLNSRKETRCDRGRPKSKLKIDPHHLWLAATVDLVAAGFHLKGSRSPIKEALKVIAEEDRKPFETIKRYYMAGHEYQAKLDVNNIFCHLDDIEREGWTDPLEGWLSRFSNLNRRNSDFAYVFHLRYRRAAALVEKILIRFFFILLCGRKCDK